MCNKKLFHTWGKWETPYAGMAVVIAPQSEFQHIIAPALIQNKTCSTCGQVKRKTVDYPRGQPLHILGA